MNVQADTLTAPPAAAISAAARLREGLLACAPAIDLSDCRLPAAEIGALYASVLYDDPALFHVALRLSYRTVTADASGEKLLSEKSNPAQTVTLGTADENPLSEKGNPARAIAIVTTVYPTYTITGDALTEARVLYRATVEGILSDMDTAFGGHAPCEAAIALYLHDTLADRYAYDTRPQGTASTGDPTGDTAPNADAYRLFRDGVGICQAYALAYLALCRAAGLEACFVSSPAMNHAWNHVRVDGRWYHVDVTRDDPIVAPGEAALVTHTRLLRTDAGMASMGYTDFSCPAGHACTDRRYEVAGGMDGTAHGAAAWTSDARSTPVGAQADRPPLAVFEEPLIPVRVGQTLIFVANLHGGATVAPRLRHGEFCGEIAVSADFAGPSAIEAGGAASAAVPVAAVYLTPAGVVVTAPGDLDGDGTLTPGDLLCIYDPTLPTAWREGVRWAVAGAPLFP